MALPHARNSKIKILVDAHVFDGSFQGTTTYIKGLYTALEKDHDFEITLAATNLDGLKKAFQGEGFKFIQLKTKNKFKRLWSEIPEIIEHGGFDFAHFQYITPFRKRCLYINTIHDLLFLDFPQYFPVSYRIVKKFLFKASGRRSDLICTVSEYSKVAISRHFSVKMNDIVLTPNAIDPKPGSGDEIKRKHRLEKYILFVSRLEPRKNHLLTLKSFYELGLFDQGFQLVFVGRLDDVSTNEYWDFYNKLPDDVKLKVLHLENLSEEELWGLYGGADLFVFPSFAEGFGIPPLEAAMAGCKVLCSNLTAMADYDFFGAFRFDPRNEPEFKAKVKLTLAETHYPHTEIQEAIRKRYNWNLIARDFGRALKLKLAKQQQVV